MMVLWQHMLLALNTLNYFFEIFLTKFQQKENKWLKLSSTLNYCD